MKATFLVLNLDGSIDAKKLNKYLMENCSDFELVLACNKKHKTLNQQHVIECVFEASANPDEVINTLIPKCGGECLFLIRKIENNDFSPIGEVAKNLKSHDEIVVIKKPGNRVTRFFKKVFGYMVKFLYGYELFDSNLAVTAFGNIPFSVLRQTENCSTYTKIDKWAGIKLVEVEGDSPKVDLSSQKWTRFVRLGAYFAVMLTTILLLTLAPSLFTESLLKIAAVVLIIFMVLLMLVDTTIILVSHFVGKNTFGQATILEILGEKDKEEDKPKAEKKTNKIKKINKKSKGE